jgi:transcriptional regulator with XRE-family HTH domain
MTLDQRIRDLRQALRLTHQALAARCGVTLRAVQAWQDPHAAQLPGRDHLQSLADVLLGDLPRKKRLAALLEDVVLPVPEPKGRRHANAS